VVNASLNWASIVGIVLAVCGGGLYFLRSFKPALARDYDVFFAAIGLLCGGILFFQGWRLDPILQFGQFLLAGTTVFFAYESVRLRGIATDQARRSSFFEDDQIPSYPRNSPRSRWDEEYDQFQEDEIPSRRFKSRESDLEEYEEERFGARRISRAIPESAVSRRRSSVRGSNDFIDNESTRRNRFEVDKELESRRNNFGERRILRNEIKRGSRPLPNQKKTRSENEARINDSAGSIPKTQRSRTNVRTQTLKDKVEDASFISKDDQSKKVRQSRRSATNTKSTIKNRGGRYNVGSKENKPRDNSSRFDD
tara:strand:+ start:11381 stop:12310 length:930 start_codon:yes stop_codon:yes gene_type:complete